MHPIMYISVSVVVASCIGGITNYLAIRMLFHPRNVRYFLGKRIPFTPGLIPKRRKEIARSLGHVVGDYLLTTEGLSELLMGPEFRRELEVKLKRLVVAWSHKEETLQELMLRYWSASELDRLQERLVTWLELGSAQGLTWLWGRLEQTSPTLGDLIPDWSERRAEQLTDWLVDYAVAQLDRELHSAHGERLLRQLLDGAMAQAGGVLGAISSLFMDQDKIIGKIKIVIQQRLASGEMKLILGQFINRKLREWENISVISLLDKYAGSAETQGGYAGGLSWLMSQSRDVLKWREWLEKIAKLELCTLLNERVTNEITLRIPALVSSGLSLISTNVERIIATLELPKLVEEQVSRFPVERIEQIVLSVSGKEFRAITWLGALLGGMIGLFQALLLRWYV